MRDFINKELDMLDFFNRLDRQRHEIERLGTLSLNEYNNVYSLFKSHGNTMPLVKTDRGHTIAYVAFTSDVNDSLIAVALFEDNNVKVYLRKDSKLVRKDKNNGK